MSRDSRRLYASPEAISRITPSLCWDFLEPFSIPLAEAGFVLPARSHAEKLDLPKLISAITTAAAKGGNEVNALSDALFFTSLIATPKNRRLLQEEIEARRLTKKLAVPDTLSDADYVIRVWLADHGLLEAAASRATLKSRRAFHYYLPTDLQVAAAIDPVNATQLEALRSILLAALKQDGRGRGLAIIPFLESPDEDWYLIRRSRLPERITYHDDHGNEVSLSVWLRVYDAIFFDRRTGVLKINARDDLEELFRAAFGAFYTGNPAFFDKRSIFTLAPLRSADPNTLHCEEGSGLSSVTLAECMYHLYEDGTLTKHVVAKKDWYGETRGLRAPIPDNAEILGHARFDVKSTRNSAATRCTVHEGNVLSISRDEVSVAFEDFLRQPEHLFMKHVHLLTRAVAA